MSVIFWIALVALGLPTLIVASFPIHAAIVLRQSRRRTSDACPKPITVVVPVRGLDEGRAHALRRLTEQQTGDPIEWLYCVEDESDPAMPELRALAATNPEEIRILVTGPSGGRLGKMHNLIEGVAAAHGEWLVFVDSDTILPHDRYLREFTAPLHTEGIGLVTCFPAYRNSASVAAALLAGAINHDLLGHFAMESLWRGLRLANGSCMAIRRDVLEGIGGFVPQSESLRMDVILARRVHAAGYQAVVHHEPVEVPCRTVTFGVWWNQAHRWQVGMAHVLAGPFYAWYCWMRSVFPVAMLTMVLASGPLAAVATVSVATRLTVMVIMGQVFVGDRSQLRYLWLLPFVDIVSGFGCWYALLEDHVEWRGRTYRVLRGGVTRRIA